VWGVGVGKGSPVQRASRIELDLNGAPHYIQRIQRQQFRLLVLRGPEKGPLFVSGNTQEIRDKGQTLY
jgi:hypothetical protein